MAKPSSHPAPLSTPPSVFVGSTNSSSTAQPSVCLSFSFLPSFLPPSLPLPSSLSLSLSLSFFLSFFILGPHPWHTEVPSLRVEWEIQLPAYATAIAMPDWSHICNLQSSCSLQHSRWMLNPLLEARERTLILKDTSPALY